MPMTWPCEFTSGPPESPASMLAFVSISPVSCSDEPEPSSVAVIAWLSAVTAPGATAGVPPVPPALPSATTLSPTLTVEESPVDAVVSPDAPESWQHRDVLRLVIAHHGRLVGLAVADVGDADRGGAVDHVVVGEDLAVGRQHDAGALRGRLLIAERGGDVDDGRVDPAGDLRGGQHVLRGRRRGRPRGGPVRQPEGRPAPTPAATTAVAVRPSNVRPRCRRGGSGYWP